MNTKESNKTPIFVDFDGTLIRTDSLCELCFRAISNAPLCVFKLMYLLLCCIWGGDKAKLALKEFLVKKFSRRVKQLAFNEDLIAYLREEKAQGRKIYLVTASLESFAKLSVAKLKLFDDVFGSKGEVNLKGQRKADFLEEMLNGGDFSYAGDATCDLKVWAKAKEIIIVNARKSLIKKAKSENPDKEILIFDNRLPRLKTLLKQIRVHQWAKNILIFLPLILAHKFFDYKAITDCIIAFLSFSLLASATYILNDMFDIDNDRAHKTKKNRPIAAGNISIISAFSIMISLASIAFGLAYYLGLSSFLILLAYTVITLSYSVYIKKTIILDIITLACLYIFRLYYGAEAVNAQISFYLVMFSVFIFFSLGAMKRYVELQAKKSQKIIIGRAYKKEDMPIMAMMGVSAGMLSVLSYILYINRAAVEFYNNPRGLLLGSLLILYFITKSWIKANRGEVDADPIVYAIKTKENYILLLAFICIFLFSSPII